MCKGRKKPHKLMQINLINVDVHVYNRIHLTAHVLKIIWHMEQYAKMFERLEVIRSFTGRTLTFYAFARIGRELQQFSEEGDIEAIK